MFKMNNEDLARMYEEDLEDSAILDLQIEALENLQNSLTDKYKYIYYRYPYSRPTVYTKPYTRDEMILLLKYLYGLLQHLKQFLLKQGLYKFYYQEFIPIYEELPRYKEYYDYRKYKTETKLSKVPIDIKNKFIKMVEKQLKPSHELSSETLKELEREAERTSLLILLNPAKRNEILARESKKIERRFMSSEEKLNALISDWWEMYQRKKREEQERKADLSKQGEIEPFKPYSKAESKAWNPHRDRW